MIYYCADDYGLGESTDANIQKCIDAGALNKVSVFPNFEKVDLSRLNESEGLRICLHINLVEGKCMADKSEVPLLVDEKGAFKHTFTGLFKLNLFCGKMLEEQVYKEIRAQVLYWKGILPKDTPFCIDSHQHTHVIPHIFRALLKVLQDEKINPEYLRIPAEPILPYIKCPSLYFTYSPVNIVKQWLIKFLWLFDKGKAKQYRIPSALFMGILFSGKMDERRVRRVLPEYVKLAQKENRNIEVLFHPGYMDDNKENLKDKNVVFNDFYLSENRKTEFDSVIKISERSVHK